MNILGDEKQASTQLTLVSHSLPFRKLIVLILEEDIKTIIEHWIRILGIKLGWINDFDKLVINYDILQCVNNIDYSILDSCQFICSGSDDKTIRVWNIDTNKQIQLLKGHSGYVNSVKFSLNYHFNYHRNVICSSSYDKTIRFWDVKYNQQLQIFNGHTSHVFGIEFSSFNGGRYLCSGSGDNTMRLWDVETSKSLHVFNGHTHNVFCVDFSPLQNNNINKDNKNNSIGIIGGNGYTICSGSFDDTICIWDIETTKQLIIFKGHEHWIRSVKYGSNELGNTILSGSQDTSVRLWDIRSGERIQIFNGHTRNVNIVEYSQFAVKNSEVGGSSNVICSGSGDNTIRFWDIRSSKKELYRIKGSNKDDEILCLKFLLFKNRENKNKINDNCGYDINMCHGSFKGPIHIWG
ncbi:F-box and wd40 domain protein [Reticulomyxa filosa]|uniref:F-box and wd40 domain protein n=1 Tax=Reticulomyxa filosa TaxID=46433 RepID=X6NWL1_RETFI|nr:F-box and wd40 domain protein [Reticulomyxa filosa]|eukprot:ETO30705.1 F-box and wd40 domain protein [Reticulomyxa filosa]